jgi:hypothetical protein
MGHGGDGYREGDGLLDSGDGADAEARGKVIEGLELYLDELDASADYDSAGRAVVVPKGRKHF